MAATTAIAEAIKEGLAVFGNWQKSREKRRMKKAIDAGEQYILISEDTTLTDKRKAQNLRTQRKRFFKYNQG